MVNRDTAKRRVSRALQKAVIAFLLLGMLPVAFAADAAPRRTEIGRYGQKFITANGVISPQYDVYVQLLQAFRDRERDGVYLPDRQPDRITVSWLTSPLMYNSRMRDEGMEAFRLDFPQYDLDAWYMTRWDTVLEEAYTSRLTLELAKSAQIAQYDYAARLAEAESAVRTAGTAEKKVFAAADWLLENCTFDEAAFNTYKLSPFPKGTSFEADGVFSYGKAAHQGFTDAFRILMEDAGIPCEVGRGVNTTWTYIQLDGNWYTVDLGSAARFGSKNYVLRGNWGYEETSPIGTAMHYVGTGSGLTTSAVPYISPDARVKITVALSGNGGVEITDMHGNVINQGESVPSGCTLNVHLSPAEGSAVRSVSPAVLLEWTADNTYRLSGVREDTEIIAVMSEIVTPMIELELRTPDHGAVTVSAMDDSGMQKAVTELQHGMNRLQPGFGCLDVRVSPDTGYELAQVVLESCDAAPDGGKGDVTAYSFTKEFPGWTESGGEISGLAQFNALRAEFRPAEGYVIIKAQTRGGGMLLITDDGNGNAVVEPGDAVAEGGRLTLRLIADSGNTARLLVNGVDLPLNGNGQASVTVVDGLLLEAVFEAKDSVTRLEPTVPGGSMYQLPSQAMGASNAGKPFTMLALLRGRTPDEAQADPALLLAIGQAVADEYGRVVFPPFVCKEPVAADIYISRDGDDNPRFCYYILPDDTHALGMYFNKAGGNRKIADFTYRLLRDEAEVAGGKLLELAGAAAVRLRDGIYTIEVIGDGYLQYRKTVTIAGEDQMIPAVMLLGGDLNGDGVIDESDRAELLQANAYGKQVDGTTAAAMDLNADGMVDLLDLNILLRNYHAQYE